MILKQKTLFVFILLCCATYLAKSALEEETLAKQAMTAMDASASFYESISTSGGYVGIYSLDLKHRYGEALSDPAKPMDIWVQPPGTPSVGLAFLRAYQVTKNDRYLAAARAAGRALAWGQCAEGGWSYKVDVSDLKPDSKMPTRKTGRCTLDDCTTQGALDFLMSMDEVLDEPWLSEAIRVGLAYMLESQFPNGAWPQCYPLRGRFYDYYTFNDKAINDCIKVMLKAHRLYEKDEYLRSAQRGGEFIILSQLPQPQAGWAQQYSHDLKPAPARVYEPAGVCSQVTAYNIKTLVDIYLYTQNGKYLAPIPKAIAWLGRSKIGRATWSRIYEIGSNRPIYSDKDGKIYYNLDQISKDRQSGYDWQGGFAVTVCIGYYEKVKRLGAKQYLDITSVPLSLESRRRKAQSLAPTVEKAVSTLDENGRWVRGNMIYIGDFVKNFNSLCEYLELSGANTP